MDPQVGNLELSFFLCIKSVMTAFTDIQTLIFLLEHLANERYSNSVWFFRIAIYLAIVILYNNW